MKPLQVLVISMAGIVLFDTVGSVASQLLGFNYGSLIAGSILIYLCSGVLAARYGKLAWALITGAATGLSDSTVGWLVSALIGPGRVNYPVDASPRGIAGVAMILFTIAIVTVLATGCGFLGGLIGSAWKRARAH